MIANGASAYRKTQVTTATPVQLVIQLYDGAIRFSRGAVQAIEAGELEGAHHALMRTQAIVTELRATLNPDAGEVAGSLALVYDGWLRQLVAANVRKDSAAIREVLRHLEDLRAAWETIASQAASASDVPLPAVGAPAR